MRQIEFLSTRRASTPEESSKCLDGERWPEVCGFKKKNPAITFIEMRLSTLPLILQVNFDCHLYGTEGRDHLRPWGMSKQMKLDQCQYLQWLYSPCLVFFFFLHTMSTLVWKIPWMEEPGGLHSSVLAWRIPGMGEPGGLQSRGLQRVRHNWVTEHVHTPKDGTHNISWYLLKFLRGQGTLVWSLYSC